MVGEGLCRLMRAELIHHSGLDHYDDLEEK